MSRSDVMSLISMNEKNSKNHKGAAALSAVPLFMAGERRSDPAVIKSLRMFRPSKKLGERNESKKLVHNGTNDECTSIKKNNVTVDTTTAERKFAPMLSTLNLLPSICLIRIDEIDKKLIAQRSRKLEVTPADVKKELSNIQRNMYFSYGKNSVNSVSPQKRIVSNHYKIFLSISNSNNKPYPFYLNRKALSKKV